VAGTAALASMTAIPSAGVASSPDPGSTHAEAPSASTVKTVTNTHDTGKGSLRAALFKVNNPSLNFDTVHFAIKGTGPHLIRPATPLPAVTAPVTIDGYSQPGTSRATASQAATLDIVINCSKGVAGAGLRIDADDSLITGLVINGAALNGIVVTGDGNTLSGNYVGTDATGELRRGNGDVGISMTGDHNQIAGDVGDRNIVSNNGGFGIQVTGVNNALYGNYIGIDDDGAVDRGNAAGGLQVLNGVVTLVGTVGEPNVISGNGGPGVHIEADSYNDVSDNLIGTDAAASYAIPNDAEGVLAETDDMYLQENIVAGNEDEGIEVQGDRAIILSNLVGVSGTPPLTTIPNGGTGIEIVGDDAKIGEVDFGNAVAANGRNGIGLIGDGDSVISNFIGTDSAGTPGLGNLNDGVLLLGTHSTIGGDAADEGNVISGNNENCLEILSPTERQGDDLVAHNLIGTDPAGDGSLANNDAGVSIQGSRVQVSENRIAFNGRHGVLVDAGSDNPITHNSIDLNGLLGIDLSPVGRTANDSGDGDTGPNDLLNYPAVTSASSVGTTTTVGWEIVSGLPNTDMILEFFASDACNQPTGSPNYGEGAGPIGTRDVVTDALGNADGVKTFPVPTTPGDVVTATATLVPVESSPTSEFSHCRTVTQGRGVELEVRTMSAATVRSLTLPV